MSRALGKLKQEHINELYQKISKLKTITEHYISLYKQHQAKCGCDGRGFTDLLNPRQMLNNIVTYRKTAAGLESYLKNNQ